MDLRAAAPVAATRPAALDAPTLCHAFQLTAAERPDEIALRNPGDAIAITWREYAERVERIAAGLAALGVERGDSVGADAAQPARVPPRRHRRPAPRRGPVLGLQHRHHGAGRPPVPQRPQPRGRHRGALPAQGPGRGRRRARGRPPRADRRRRRRHRQPRRARGHRAQQLPLRRDLAGGRAGGPRRDHLHVGHHRPAEGRRAEHANAMAECVASAERYPLAPGGRTISYLPSAHVVDRWSSPLVGLAHPRLLRHLGRRHADGDLPAAEHPPDQLGRGAADLGEAPPGARRPGHHRPRRAGRGGARGPARAARARRRRAPRRRRRPDADRRPALLRGARAPDHRGLGDVGDGRAPRSATRPARAASAPAARRCPGSSWSSRTTASCSSAARW